MPFSMPYHLETGPTLGRIESFLNEPATDLRAVLASLWANTLDVVLKNVVKDVLKKSNPEIYVPTATSVDGQPTEPLADSVSKAWFGENTGGVWEYDNDDDPSYEGRWLFYKGRPQEILRQGFIRAIEISLGVGHGAPPAQATRRWPIVLMWKCAQPWLETWIQWRTNPGVVIVVICTPGDGNHIALDPDLAYNTDLTVEPGQTLTNKERAAKNGYVHQPVHYEPNGSIVVTHDSHSFDPKVARSTVTTQKLSGGMADRVFGKPVAGAPIPWFGAKFCAAEVAVVAVSPTVPDGGVKANLP